MKKFRIVSLIALGVMLLAGCNVSADELAKFREAYDNTKSAAGITQNIEVTRGKLAVYLYEKEYEKTETGYDMTYTEQRLNKIDGETEEAYTVTTGSDSVSAAETFNPALKLELSSFRYGYELQADSFRGEIRDGMEDNVFGFTAEHAEMENVVLSLQLDGNALKSLGVVFTSGVYSVSISISFS